MQQESSQGPAQSAAELTVNPRKVSQWQQSRPEGVSKVDLTTVWGHTRTPLADTATAAGAKLAFTPFAPEAQGALKTTLIFDTQALKSTEAPRK